MSTPRDLDRALEAWLAEGPPMTADRVVGAALDRIGTVKQQRRHGLLAVRPRAWASVAAAVIVVAALYLIGVLGNVGGPSPSQTPAPITTPSPSPLSTPQAYTTTTFAIPMSLRVPTGWRLQQETTEMIDFGSAAILSVADTGIFDEQGAAQPWPADVLAWISAEPAFGAPEVAAVTVGGRAAIEYSIEVDYAPEQPGGRKPLIHAGSVRWNLIDAAERWRFAHVATGDGQGLMVVLIASSRPSFDVLAADLDGLLGSVEFH